MKNQALWIPLVFFCLAFLCTTPSHAQQPDDLPAGKKLAANGLFVPDRVQQAGRTYSENGRYEASYAVGRVSDENRELLDFRLFENGRQLYSKTFLPGADVLVSNSGLVAVFNMDLHFNQEVTVHLFDRNGTLLASESLRYASLFGFSPGGGKFVAGTDRNLYIHDLEKNTTATVGSCSKYGFSEDESILVTAREDRMRIYQGSQLLQEVRTGLFYPRALAVDTENRLAVVIGKSKLLAYDLDDYRLRFEASSPPNESYRDVSVQNGKICAGLHFKENGTSQGILRVFNADGQLLRHEVMAEKQFRTFKDKVAPSRSNTAYNPVPWPFEPFDEVHKVWNHYEQHMGDGSGTWSYLHQGLDLEVPINEPTYAVEEGWVKLVLTIGGDAYWRVAVSPEQSSGYSDGWLYAHLVQSSIQVDVGDYVELHDYLGDIIYWSADWGHIHFVNIRDQGDIWYYNDDEWGINFNPLLALTPITDDYGPVIEEFSASSKFGYCVNETSSYLSPDELTGEVDIIARISDYHGTSEWEQPAYRTYYWVQRYPDGGVVFPKTLGQILNHTYSMYNGGYYEAYAPLMYKKDYMHPSPPWMNHQRDYFQVLTNNNGDSIAEPEETELAFNTAAHYDGTYQVFIEAWDEYGNMAIDSQVVTFTNGYISNIPEAGTLSGIVLSPNPVRDRLNISGCKEKIDRVTLYDSQMVKVTELPLDGTGQAQDACTIHVRHLAEGIYFVKVESGRKSTVSKIIKL